MIITPEEYYEMGFTADDIQLLDNCLKRAEYTLSGVTDGKIYKALSAGGRAADCAKQAAGFQTYKLVKEESGFTGSERVTVGDFSYQASGDSAEISSELSMRTVSLLRAAGCLYSSLEVAE